MSRSTQMAKNAAIIEMIPSQDGNPITEFPAGAIAHAWLDVFSQRPTWAGLNLWLSGSSATAN